ncbi:hypothetical protein EON64_18610, partial [archaeon]
MLPCAHLSYYSSSSGPSAVWLSHQKALVKTLALVDMETGSSSIGIRNSKAKSPVSRKRARSAFLECSACSDGSHAEQLHPLLKVPVCGPCKFAYATRDLFIDEANEVSCVWCGQGDGSLLFMCDSCSLSFCTDCVSRNLGAAEAKRVRDLEVWACYVCSPSLLLQAIQVEEGDMPLFSLEGICAQLRPPSLEQIPTDDLSLTSSERHFASLFFSDIGASPVLAQQGIFHYLSARDAVHMRLVRHVGHRQPG